MGRVIRAGRAATGIHQANILVRDGGRRQPLLADQALQLAQVCRSDATIIHPFNIHEIHGRESLLWLPPHQFLDDCLASQSIWNPGSVQAFDQ